MPLSVALPSAMNPGVRLSFFLDRVSSCQLIQPCRASDVFNER